MATEATKRGWSEALRVYARPSVVRMLFFGFSAGLPFLLVFTTLTAWLRDYEISRSAIGFFAWIGTTYSIKVLWAPVVDRVPLPLLTRLLGQRRSWMLLAQVGIAAGLAAMALTDPTDSLTAIALLALLVAFCSATQDITIDAFRIESDADEFQAAMAGTYVIGYRLAILVAGAGALYIADFWNWTVAYLAMAACVSVGMLAVLLSREPSSADRLDIDRDPLVQAFRANTATTGWRQEAGAWIVGSVIAPFRDFMHRYGWLALPLLALIGLYKVSDLSMAAMANPLYIDLGFSLSEIASVTKVFGIVMTLIGGMVGGVVVARYGILPMLLAGALLVALTNLVFAWLATVGYSIPALFVTIGADNFANGFSATVFIAFLSSLVSRRYTATQYALFSSFMTLPGKIIGGPSGVIVDSAGYVTFFVYASALGIPAILLIVWLMRKRALESAADS
ncbi:AmpG family muropeptide MFS transporter [Wenzhouxiangella sp. XN79A]|uniref:AmpG family muropeptide MFS transporter n=1 Tax=Wenzhouxiangella sp. XN79A TaxID=2724193 RepID=UPI00144AC020|nr:MFS transporter [Wenzhouxiangella sp. XN79A]NKI36145.1 AmpG family muropeptide MFS transporter [Wenzhouxiangella sp. XN79A]